MAHSFTYLDAQPMCYISHTCTNLMILGGIFLLRKSNTLLSPLAIVFRWTILSDVNFLLISLLIRMSRMLMDNNFVTSELKKLLRTQISSMCYILFLKLNKN